MLTWFEAKQNMETHATSMFTVTGFQVKFCKEVGMLENFYQKKELFRKSPFLFFNFYHNSVCIFYRFHKDKVRSFRLFQQEFLFLLLLVLK
jgi:hypothetical protein